MHAPAQVDLRPLQRQVNHALSWQAADSSSSGADSARLRISPGLDELYGALGCLEASQAAAREACQLVQDAQGEPVYSWSASYHPLD